MNIQFRVGSSDVDEIREEINNCQMSCWNEEKQSIEETEELS